MDARGEYRFDGWTLRRATGELQKDGCCQRLQSQPLQVLEALLARPGELVTRKELISLLWPRGVVEFDTALNSAVRRLRSALGDDADAPRYIETIPRRGYRFIGRLEPRTEPARVDVHAPSAVPVRHARLRHVRPRYRAAAAILLIAIAVVVAAGARPTGKERGPAVTSTSTHATAAESRDRARYFLKRRGDGDLVLAGRYFRAALALDPANADAWAGLSSVYWLDVAEGRVAPAQGLPRLRDAADRALALNARNAEALVRLGNHAGWNGNALRAKRYFDRARAAAPSDPLVLGSVASADAWEGRFGEAIELQRKAVQVDPLATVPRCNLVAWLVAAGRYTDAEVELRRLREIVPDNQDASKLLGDVLLLQGRYDEALVQSREIRGQADRAFVQAVALAALGHREESDAALQSLIAAGKGETFRVAEVYAWRGDRDAAFQWLQSSVAEYGRDPWIQHSPFMRPLRADPRWDEWLTAARHYAAREEGFANSG